MENAATYALVSADIAPSLKLRCRFALKVQARQPNIFFADALQQFFRQRPDVFAECI